MSTDKYRMSYLCRVGPPKARADLLKDEGLTDYLVIHSVLGIPGGPGGLSVQTVQVGPEGGEELTPQLAHALATMLLNAALPGLTGRVAETTGAALALLRAPFLDRIAESRGQR